MVKKGWGPNQTVWKLYVKGHPSTLAVVSLARRYSWMNDMNYKHSGGTFAGKWYDRVALTGNDTPGIRLRLL